MCWIGLSVVPRSVWGMSGASAPEPPPGSDSETLGSSATGGIAQAHDRYFRAGLQGRAEQVALIGSLFPTLVPLLDADSVTALDGTFVDEELTLRQTDLALQVSVAGRDVIVYVLVEHQSSVDPLMALRMLRYQP